MRFSRSEEGSALRMETAVIPAPASPIALSSAEEGGDETEENGNAISKKMHAQQPESTEAESSSPRHTPMDLKEEGEKTLPKTSLQPTQGSVTKQDTTVTTHNTQPLRARRPPKFLGERLLTSVVTGGSLNVNVAHQTEIGKVPKASSSFAPRMVNRSRGGGNANVAISARDKIKKAVTQSSPKKFPSSKR